MYYNNDDCDCAHGKPTLHEVDCFYRPKHLRNQDNYNKTVEELKQVINTASSQKNYKSGIFASRLGRNNDSSGANKAVLIL